MRPGCVGVRERGFNLCQSCQPGLELFAFHIALPCWEQAELLELVVLPRTSPARAQLDGRMENLKGKLLANVAFKGKEGETIRTGDRPVFWRVLHVVNNGSY